MIGALLWLFNMVVLLYIFAILAVLVLSWLIAFKVVDAQQPFAARVAQGLFAVTNPVLNPLRRIIPSIGGLDFSPIVAMLILEFVRRVVDSLAGWRDRPSPVRPSLRRSRTAARSAP